MVQKLEAERLPGSLVKIVHCRGRGVQLYGGTMRKEPIKVYPQT